MKVNIYKLDLPWPQGWDQMQWLIAAWLARHGKRATVHVCWNETRLHEEVDAAAFKSITTDFYRALQSQLNEACQWHFDKQDVGKGHLLVLGLRGPSSI
jgi:hypothetical protein